MWDEPDVELRGQTTRSCRFQKRCWFIKTAGRWPWKLESAKECVTTHLPNELALKMDGAKAGYRNSPIRMIHFVLMSRRAWAMLRSFRGNLEWSVV